MASECDIPWRAIPFTAKISSPETKGFEDWRHNYRICFYLLSTFPDRLLGQQGKWSWRRFPWSLWVNRSLPQHWIPSLSCPNLSRTRLRARSSIVTWDVWESGFGRFLSVRLLTVCCQEELAWKILLSGGQMRPHWAPHCIRTWLKTRLRHQSSPRIERAWRRACCLRNWLAWGTGCDGDDAQCSDCGFRSWSLSLGLHPLHWTSFLEWRGWGLNGASRSGATCAFVFAQRGWPSCSSPLQHQGCHWRSASPWPKWCRCHLTLSSTMTGANTLPPPSSFPSDFFR